MNVQLISCNAKFYFKEGIVLPNVSHSFPTSSGVRGQISFQIASLEPVGFLWFAQGHFRRERGRVA